MLTQNIDSKCNMSFTAEHDSYCALVKDRGKSYLGQNERKVFRPFFSQPNSLMLQAGKESCLFLL